MSSCFTPLRLFTYLCATRIAERASFHPLDHAHFRCVCRPATVVVVVVNDENGDPVVRVLRNDKTVNGVINQQLTFAQAQDLSTGSNTQFVLAGDIDGLPGEDLVAIDAGGSLAKAYAALAEADVRRQGDALAAS